MGRVSPCRCGRDAAQHLTHTASAPDRLHPYDEHVVCDYLADIAAILPGNTGQNADLLVELGDGFTETLLSHRQSSDLGAAAQKAIAEFGSPEEVAAAHTAHVRVRQIRTHALQMVGLLLIVGGLWNQYARYVGDLTPTIPSGPIAASVYEGLTVAMPILPVISQIAAILLALVSLRATLRWCEHTGPLLQGLTVTTCVLLTATFLTASGMFALMSSDLSLLHRWFAPAVFMVGIGAPFAVSLLTMRRWRHLHALDRVRAS